MNSILFKVKGPLQWDVISFIEYAPTGTKVTVEKTDDTIQGNTVDSVYYDDLCCWCGGNGPETEDGESHPCAWCGATS